jgi:pre-rRNA-processing protein TSR3
MREADYPKTVLIIHPKEKRVKCSLEPLRGRADLCFVDFSPMQPVELPGYVRLSVEGPPLSDADAKCGILLIDGSWRHAERMHEHFAAVPPRSLAGFRTAYPRVSKLFHDPAEGLASVEALYIAHRILGRPTHGLLDAYFWREQFLRLNGWA